MRRWFAAYPVMLTLGACAHPAVTVNSNRAVTVVASGETVPVGTSTADAADDPAIWRNPANPVASLIVATDKKAGLYLYGLDGKVRDFQPDGRLNNVDLIEVSDGSVLVAASDRNDIAAAKLRLYRLDTAAAKLVPLGTVAAGTGEAYGVCLWHPGAAVEAFSVLKDGTVVQVRLNLAPGAVTSQPLRKLKLNTQTEGCVVDPRTAALYVGEEDVGIWRFGADAAAPVGGTLVARADGQHLVADVEGLALVQDGPDGGWLIASSQGDNAYAVYALPDMVPAGRFRIGAGTFGATEETDGIAFAIGDFGLAFPGGLFIAQDGINAAAAQNFKLVPWFQILRALRQSDIQN